MGNAASIDERWVVQKDLIHMLGDTRFKDLNVLYANQMGISLFRNDNKKDEFLL
jgi:hypothetical protein